MTNIDSLKLFPANYQESRQRFRQNLERVQSRWPAAALYQYEINNQDGMTIDWISSPAGRNNRRVLLLTTGEHGIEGYVGSAMLQLFLDRCLDQLDPDDTGLVLLHAINPWGMYHWRRTNSNNVDLNRNFLFDPSLASANFNPERTRLEGFLSPTGLLRNYWVTRMRCLLGVLFWLVRLGERPLRETVLLGQYRQSKGIFYGGDAIQAETNILMGLYRQAFEEYSQVLHLDMHTGYGPRYQMSLVNSALDQRNSDEFVSLFNYPLVVAATGEEFYPIRGDMIDYIYTLRDQDYPDKKLYATSFEFGTYGESNAARARMFATMILENQLYHYGAANPGIRRRVGLDFQELFYPKEPKWCLKALKDADQAFSGILSAECYTG